MYDMMVVMEPILLSCACLYRLVRSQAMLAQARPPLVRRSSGRWGGVEVLVLSLVAALLQGAVALPTVQEYAVTDLPGAPDGLAPMYAGYVPVSGVLPNTTRDGYLFFWLHESQGRADDPLVIWLNGGPGCSSLLGMMFECGPLHMDGATGALGVNPYAWNKGAHLLFVEQPVETGFSYSAQHKFVDDEQHLARDFYSFLVNWLSIFHDKTGLDIYIVGESYAGMYAPSIASEVMRQNKRHPSTPVHLKGIAIGNGWVDSYIQTASYPEFAFARGLVDEQGRQWLRQQWTDCLASTEEKERVTAGDLNQCRIMEKALAASGHPNEYDVSTYTPYSQLVASGSPFASLLNSMALQEAVHVTGSTMGGALPKTHSWQVCNDAMVMSDDHPVSMSGPLSQLLEDGMRVLVYNGDQDFNCNFMGSGAYLDALNWPGQSEWLTSPRSVWTPHGLPAGYYKSHANLGFLVIRNSGHLVPMDRPKEALDLIYRFTRGLSFADESLPSPWLPDSSPIPNDDDTAPPSHPTAPKPSPKASSATPPRPSHPSFTPPASPNPTNRGFLPLRDLLLVMSFLVGALLTLLGSVMYASYTRRRARGYQSVQSPTTPAIVRVPSAHAIRV